LDVAATYLLDYRFIHLSLSKLSISGFCKKKAIFRIFSLLRFKIPSPLHNSRVNPRFRLRDPYPLSQWCWLLIWICIIAMIMTTLGSNIRPCAVHT